MNIPTRKIDDDLMMERYDSSDKAYNRTPKEQAKIDDTKAGFDENSADYEKKNPYANTSRRKALRLKSRRSEDAEDGEMFAKIDQDASNGLGKAELEKIYGADVVEAYIKDGEATGKFEGGIEDAENAGREMGQSFGIDTIEDAETTNPLKSDRVESDLKSKNRITDRIEDAETVVVHRRR